MIRFIFRALAAALGFWLAARIVPGVYVVEGESGLRSLLAAGLLLGIVNAIIRPILVILTLPLTVVTLGLFLLVINGIMVKIVDFFLNGIEIHGLWHAMLVALIVSLTVWVVSWFVDPREERRGA
ncbi:phage holin family protein [Caulobacter sp. KR2-114]|uniref:phage holin family protein n=1 Tax=Caulobacter sp. KR2-114 TaxID=3400912 RepID=UPI003C052BA2